MSFGATLDVGSLVSKFVLDASGAAGTIQAINQNATQIKNAFGNVVFKLDAGQSQSSIQALTQATVAFKTAQTQATDALTQQRTALTQTKTALDQQRTATESVRTATAQFVQGLTQQRTATESARTATAQARAELAQMALAERQAADEAKNTSSAFSVLKRGLEFGAGLLAFRGISEAVKGIGDAAIGTNASLEQSQLKFVAFTGSVQAANDLLAKTEVLASHSTFGLAQISEADGQLLAFNVNAANVPPLMLAIENASAAAGGNMAANFTNLTKVIGELAGGLPLTERQVRQLVTAGVPLQPLAQQLGVTVDQLLATGKTGQISGDQLVAAFAKVYTQGDLGDFMQKQAGTFSGAIALIKTNLDLAVAQGFQPLFQAISNVTVKFGEFIQTATFQQWVAQLRSAVSAAIAIFKEFMSVLEPIGSAIAKVFGFNTANIGAEMEAVKNAKVDVGQFDASLQAAGKTTDDTKEKLGAFKNTIDDAALAIAGLNGELNANKLLLDANAQAIQAVNDKYNPTIASATESIRKLNILSPEELSRKQRELELDRDKANLELTRPDTSSFDSRILSDQTTLANMPRLDTSGYDDAIAAAQASLETLQGQDPAAGVKSQIQDLQDQISGLNTDEFDRKINAIKDKLAEPAPDTTGISNQLNTLNQQLAGGTISQTAFDQQYGALSRQKQTINQQYTDDTTGLKGQLKLLEQQRADQALSNQETAKADRTRIEDLKEQQKVIEDGHKADIKAQEDIVKSQTKARTDAEKADAKARQDLQDDITKEGNLRTQALKPYTDAMKVITDEQAHNAALDQAAAAQRTLDLAPYKKALDDATEAKRLGLVPLDEEKERLDKIKTGLDEQKATQTNIRQEAEAQAAALKAGAESAKTLSDNLKTIPATSGIGAPDLARLGRGEGIAPPTSPFIQFANDVKAKLAELTGSEDWSVVFYGKHKDGTPVNAKERWTTAANDIVKGLDGIDAGIQSWIKDHDASGIWGVLLYGKNPDGTNATAQRQITTLFEIIGAAGNGALKKIGIDWTSDWDDTGHALRVAWGGPDGFNWDNIQNFFNGIVTGHSAWMDRNAPDWLTSWTGLGGALKKAWDGPESFNWTSVGTFFSGIAAGIDKFGTDHFPTWLTSWSGLAKGLGDAFSGLGTAISENLKGPTKEIGNFFNFLGGGVHWLAKHFPGVKDIPDFGNDNGVVAAGSGAAGSSGGTGAGAGPGYAGGVTNSPLPGHWGLVGERGPEPMWVPPGATIVPNDTAKAWGMLPGHEAGLNFDFLGDALGGITKFVGGSASKAVDAIMAKVGIPATGIFPGLGASLVDMGKTGLLGFLRPQEVAQSLGSGTYGGALGPLLNLIRSSASQYGLPADIIGAIILHESGGIIGRTEVGGGLGRGLMQVDGGTWPQAYDPRMSGTSLDDAAFQIDIGSMVLKRAFDAANGDIEAALTGYSGTGFASQHGGLDFYQELLKMGLIAQADAALAMPSSATVGALAGGGWPGVVAAAQARVGQFFQDNGEKWWFWCEKFVNDMDQAAGFTPRRANTAKEHDLSANLQGGMAPPGAAWYWSFDPAGHTAISTGDGGLIGTFPDGVQYGNISQFGQPDGWLPPGLKDGGYFPANDPRLAIIGEGGSDEIVAPTDKLREIVRTESRGNGPLNLTFSPGAITVMPDGSVRVDQSKIGLMDDWHASGHL